ncbi:hypothetical protein GWC77_26890 [Paraburkholderia sp. NMBU_R16]|uniref:hypothetical protein n=1 Tax=Paraburkholderia sp. NMBU_R16 TaxID=2698676 RepID=UPI001566D12B|nr:hypothetical protein [Paraburkholderia sp. NMBU_R16]NRO99504.1 hypothetical protein [Paraburkholderia sp. NMBU_R16]
MSQLTLPSRPSSVPLKPTPATARSAAYSFVSASILTLVNQLQRALDSSAAWRHQSLLQSLEKVKLDLSQVPKRCGVQPTSAMQSFVRTCEVLVDVDGHLKDAKNAHGPLTAVETIGPICKQLHTALIDMEAQDLPREHESLRQRLANAILRLTSDSLNSRDVDLGNIFKQISKTRAAISAPFLMETSTNRLSPTRTAGHLRALQITRERALASARECVALDALARAVVSSFGDRMLTDPRRDAKTTEIVDFLITLVRTCVFGGAYAWIAQHQHDLTIVLKSPQGINESFKSDIQWLVDRCQYIQAGLKDEESFGKQLNAHARGEFNCDQFDMLIAHEIHNYHEVAVDARSLIKDAKLNSNKDLLGYVESSLRGIADAADFMCGVLRDSHSGPDRRKPEGISRAEMAKVGEWIFRQFGRPLNRPTTSGPREGMRQEPIDLSWIDEEVPAPQPSQKQSKKAKKKQSTAPSKSTTHDSGLVRAFQRAAAEPFLPVQQEAQQRSQWLIDQARRFVNAKDGSPVSVARVQQYVANAITALEDGVTIIRNKHAALVASKSQLAGGGDKQKVAAQIAEQYETVSVKMLEAINSLRNKQTALQRELEALPRAQLINTFLRYPTPEVFKHLRQDRQVDIRVTRLASGKKLAAETISGFKKPNEDYLNAYEIDIVDGDESRGHVEFHAHYNSTEPNASARVGHFKNANQAHEGGNVHRGRLHKFDLQNIINWLDYYAR